MENYRPTEDVNEIMLERYEYRWWESSDPLDLAWGQLDCGILAIPQAKFYKALEAVLGREITPKKGFEIPRLQEEIMARFPAEALERITKKKRQE